MGESDVCATCDGTTWQRIEKDGVPLVERCSCWLGKRKTEAMVKVMVPGRYRDCAFDARSGGKPFDRLQPSLTRSGAVAEEWADRFPDSDAGLLFTGPPGVGKTHLAVAILRRIVIERQITAAARFTDFRSLLREIKGSYHPDTPATEMEVLRPILDAEPLVLDDLGGESPTLWVFDTLFYILNHRYNERKLTIITTNFSDRTTNTKEHAPRSARPSKRDESLSERITVRLRSRLYEMCRDVRIQAEDYRMNTLQANFREDVS